MLSLSKLSHTLALHSLNCCSLYLLLLLWAYLAAKYLFLGQTLFNNEWRRLTTRTTTTTQRRRRRRDSTTTSINEWRFWSSFAGCKETNKQPRPPQFIEPERKSRLSTRSELQWKRKVPQIYRYSNECCCCSCWVFMRAKLCTFCVCCCFCFLFLCWDLLVFVFQLLLLPSSLLLPTV